MRNRKLIIFLLAWSITNSRPISTQLKWKVHSKDCIIQYLLICLWGMLQFSMIFSVFDAESSTVCRVALPNEKWQAAALGSRRMNRRFSWSPCSGSIHGRMRPGFPCKSNRNTNTPYRLVLTAICCWGTMRCGRPNNAGMIQKQILNNRTVRRFRTQTGDPGARFKEPSSRFRAQNAVYLQGVWPNHNTVYN